MAPSTSSRSSQSDPLTALIDLTNTILSLTSQFSQTLTSTAPSQAPHPSTTTTSSSPSSSSSTPAPTPPNPLAVLHTSATLLKAHTTKLGLLLLQPSLEARALHGVLRDISSTCLPAMMSAVALCGAETHGAVLGGEVRSRVGRCVREVEGLVMRVRGRAVEARDGDGGGEGDGDGGARGVTEVTGRLDGLDIGVIDARAEEARIGSRDTLASTGVGWEACEGLIELAGMGLRGLVVKRAEEWRDMVKDAVEELKEWGEEGDDDDGEEDDEFEEDGIQDIIQEMFGANKLPRGHEELRVQLEMTLKKLKLVVTLYQAIIKRRLKTLPSLSDIDPEITHRVDELMPALKGLPDKVDEIASSFYEIDGVQAQESLDSLCDEACGAVRLVSQNWLGQEDEFSGWSSKWLDVLDKTGKTETR